MTDKQALREAAEKYRTTYAAHLKNPRNYDALDAWDKATSEFMALVNNDELNIIASLIDEIDMETGYREGAFVACNRWHTKFRETEAKLEAAEKRIADYHRVLNNLAAVARRYLPDYDEHHDIQAADDLLESAAGIGKGE
ncbi:ead/Ea22-like family protein [Citrobacter sp. CK184]|uniref:ead/Ea22-like family protein n=1 Tax=unclassified Citrobacter TaxID=2644389 RepID=UPI002578936B|nr:MULTISPECIES: ead/Ea22-like family protein [unclassified Citrobacter]MDM3030198.1 ead/Ea22-like family protein [Citrobacter sp. CK185]MDM3048734.1 ead/Ea22-like family protein [Citrobacter sp. CK184]